MNTLLSKITLFLSLSLPVGAVNIAGSGTGLMGSNDATIGDAGSAHAQAGTVANIRDGNLTTRVDNYQTGQAANVNGYVGISWATARTDVIKSVTLTLATFVDGGWFGNYDTPLRSNPLTPEMLVQPVVQVSTNLTAWTTVPATMNYATAFSGHIIAGDNTPTSRTFNITLPQWQTGIRGIRVIGTTGGYGDGNGFLGVFEMEVNADVLTDSDADGMDDAWETANGLAVGTNDAALDTGDGDGLTNVQEFRWQTNPQLADSDGDTLTDGAEANTHLTFPGAADTDGDTLTDAAEVNTHFTNPLLADMDADGLTDAAEIVTHLTLPANRDTDGDGFSDGIEITLGTVPLSDASRPLNIARAGTAVMGLTPNAPRGTAGRTANIADGDLLTLAVTSSSTTTLIPGYAGVTWPSAWPQPVSRMEVTLATMESAGWFGSLNGATAFTALTASNITGAPALQTTTDGVNWTTVPAANYTVDYVTRFIGHVVGGPGRQEATRRSAVLTMNTPIAGLRGIRVSGNCKTLLSVAEVTVCDDTNTTDTDGDGLSNAAEANAGTSPLHEDSDGDGLRDGAEATAGSNPLVADTDADFFPDGIEVREGTNPASPASHPANLSIIGGGVIGTATTGNPAVFPTITGTTVINAGITDAIVDGSLTSRVDNYNGNSAEPYGFVGARFMNRVKAAELRVRFATFVNGGWFGPGTGPAAGGALTAAHLAVPQVQVTFDHGTTWWAAPATTDYLTTLTGHVIASGTTPTMTPPVTFALLTPATGINGIRLIGREGGSAQPFVGVFDFAVTPSYAATETSVSFPWVTVGDPGNAPHASGLGAVGYTFQISAHETTIAQYCSFLNAVAASDPNGLWSADMSTSRQVAGIFRDGTSGSYVYHVMGDGRRPITFVSWFDAARFVNWLSNGQAGGSTETGVYPLAEPSALTIAQIRAPGSTFALPSRDEWYKAACFDPAKPGGAGYWNYAMRSDTLPPNTTGGNYFADNTYAAWPGFNLAQASYLLPAGHYTAAASAYGTFDQTGSVWEHIEHDTGSHRDSMGWSWFETTAPGPMHTLVQQRQPTEKTSIAGFRVVSVPPAPAVFGGAPAHGEVTSWVGGNNSGAVGNPGPNFSLGASFQTETAAFTGAALPVSVSDSYWNVINGSGSVTNFGNGIVSLGKIALTAGNTSPNDAFYGGHCEGGWEESLLVTAPGLSGTTAYLQLNVDIFAHLHAGAEAGLASFKLLPLTDGPPFSSGDPGLNTGTATGNYPNLQWNHAYFATPVPTPVVRTVSETITLSIPVIIGQKQRFSLYGVAHGGMRAVYHPPDVSTGFVNATAKTSGIVGVVNASNVPIPGYVVLTNSATNYSTTLPPVYFGVTDSSITLLPNGSYQLAWSSLPGQDFQIDCTSDLQTWIPLPGVLTATDNLTTRIITPPPGTNREFFRVWRRF